MEDDTYVTSNSLQHNINHNVLPKSVSASKGKGGSGGYSEAAAGNPESNNEKDFEFEAGFDEVKDLSGLQPFSGDVLIEGRYGQSIRLGHTPSGAGTSKDPSWSGDPTKPITIIRNHQEEGGWNKFVIEDVDKDDSSIYLTSGQTVKLSTPNSLPPIISTTSGYSDKGIFMNSGRIHLNARDESIILSSKDNLRLVQVDMLLLNEYLDDLLEILKIIADGKYPTPVGPTGPLHPVSKVAALKSKISQ